MSIIIFLVVFSVIVTFHELGHYYFAKRAGVHVYEFAIGMGPKIFQTFKNGTAYTIRALPFGGYVRLAGDDSYDLQTIEKGQLILVAQNEDGIITHLYLNTQEQIANTLPIEVHDVDLVHQMVVVGKVGHYDHVETFAVAKDALICDKGGKVEQVAPFEKRLPQASVWHQILINVFGPINNFILSIVVFTFVAFTIGSVPSDSNQITVAPNSSMFDAGITNGSRIIAVEDVATKTWTEITEQLKSAKATNDAVTLTVLTDSGEEIINVPFRDGIIGISSSRNDDFVSKMVFGFTETWRVATSIFAVVANIFTKGFDVNAFGGPVAIAQMSGQVYQSGWLSVVMFLAALSANLGVMNLLPIPGLDGGKLLLNLVHVLRGKPMSKEKEKWVNVAGVIILILLMLVVTFNDIMRLFK